MRTIFTRGMMAIAIAALVSSCSTSNDVASNRGIQKRKYNKGFFVSKNAKGFDKKNQTENTKQVVIKEEVAEVINAQPEISNEIKTTEKIGVENNNNVAVDNYTISSDNATTNFKETTPNSNTTAETTENNTVENKTITKKGIKKQLKQNKNKINRNSSSDVGIVVLVILAIFIPPLAVFLYEGATNRFWIDLILALLGWGLLGWFFGGLVFLGGLIAMIYALLIVTGTI